MDISHPGRCIFTDYIYQGCLLQPPNISAVYSSFRDNTGFGILFFFILPKIKKCNTQKKKKASYLTEDYPLESVMSTVLA